MENKKKYHILLVDDEPQLLEIIRRLLEIEGYMVTCVTSGTQALETFRNQPIDLILTDIRMPEMDGIEILRRIRDTDPIVPVIVLTGYGSMDLAIRALKDFGAFDFLTKPKGAPELLITVEKALRHGDLLRRTEQLQDEIQQQNRSLRRQNAELRMTKEALEKSHQRYEDLYQNAPVGYVTVDEQGRIVEANQTAAELFGIGKEALNDQSFEHLIDPKDQDNLSACREALHKNRGHVCELAFRKADGTIFSARLEAKEMHELSEKPKRFRVIITDISTQKEIQRQILESRKLDAIATLAGGIAHQFNNALAGLTGFLELIQIEFDQKNGPSPHLTSAFNLVERMAGLTRQLLTYASEGKYAPQDIQLVRFITDMLALINHNIDKGNRIETDLPEDLHWIRGDNTQLQLVLMALIQNASEAMQAPGRIIISARNVTLSADDIIGSAKRRTGDYVHLAVSDEGCGMVPSMIEKIFDPFFTTKFIGRGLGLSAVHGIISNHRGWVEVNSALGRGTRVSVYLPAVETQTVRPALETQTHTNGHDASVLVIEDDGLIRKVTRQLLGRMNYQILEAETGEEARDIVKNHPGTIDAVLLDMLLPDADGEKLYHELRSMRPDLKVILCSGYDMGQQVASLMAGGAMGFLPKPYATKTLAAELQRVIRQ